MLINLALLFVILGLLWHNRWLRKNAKQWQEYNEAKRDTLIREKYMLIRQQRRLLARVVELSVVKGFDNAATNYLKARQLAEYVKNALEFEGMSVVAGKVVDLWKLLTNTDL